MLWVEGVIHPTIYEGAELKLGVEMVPYTPYRGVYTRSDPIWTPDPPKIIQKPSILSLFRVFGDL